MNRRAELGNQVTIVMTIFLMVIVGGGIVLGVFIFFGEGTDFKSSEALLLNSVVRNCLDENNLETFINNFYEKCGLDKEIIAKNNRVKVCLELNYKNCAESTSPTFVVGSGFEECFLKGANENYPRCYMSYIEKDGAYYSIIATSNQEVFASG